MSRRSKFSAETRERAVRLVFEQEDQHDSQWAAITVIAEMVGCHRETLRNWVRQAETDDGRRPGLTTDERERLMELERENRELRRANTILRQASAYFAAAELDRQRSSRHVHRRASSGTRGRADVPSAGHRPVDLLAPQAAARHPELRSERARRHERLTEELTLIHADNYGVYGYRKVHAALAREGIQTGQDQVRALMARAGLTGVTRGRAWTTTTTSDPGAPRAVDLVERQFRAPAPNRLWVCDFTYVATWTGWVYVAFVVDAYADRIVGWRVRTTKDTGLVLDALEQAVWSRLPAAGADHQLVAHSDAGSQYLAIAYGEHLADAQILPSVGSVGDAFDNALVETIIGLFKD